MVFIAPTLKATVVLGLALGLIQASTRNNRSHNRPAPSILSFSLFARCKDLRTQPYACCPSTVPGHGGARVGRGHE